ncbi:MAG: hypothetical protein ACP5I4_01640 [Oceanipulchritudo sp.]
MKISNFQPVDYQLLDSFSAIFGTGPVDRLAVFSNPPPKTFQQTQQPQQK